MNISFIINNLSFGGAEKMATFVTNNLAKRGHEVSIFVLNAISDSHQSIDENIRVYHYNRAQKSNSYLQYYEWIRFFVPIAKKERTEVLISFLGTPNLVCTLISKILYIPSILSERGDLYTGFIIVHLELYFRLLKLLISMGKNYRRDQRLFLILYLYQGVFRILNIRHCLKLLYI